MVCKGFINYDIFSLILKEGNILREDISEVLFCLFKDDDPYRASKLLQIERWCYAHWN
jgi:hypothetical protein